MHNKKQMTILPISINTGIAKNNEKLSVFKRLSQAPESKSKMING